MSEMRTTLTIDDDVAARINHVRRQLGLPMKQAINLLLREGLDAHASGPKKKRYRTEPTTLGLRPGFDAMRLNQLADDLEAEEAAGKLSPP